MRRYLHPFLLVFAFLFAQAGYTAHLATHLMAPASQEHGHTSDGSCEVCISYAQLGSGPLAFTLYQPPVLSAVQDWMIATSPSCKPVISLYVRARGPPVPLI